MSEHEGQAEHAQEVQEVQEVQETAAPAAAPEAALVKAAQLEDFAELQRLVAAGEDVNQQDGYGDTALHVAVGHKKSVVKFLLDHGADVNRANGVGSTPLHKAAMRGDGRIVAMLLRAGADAGVRNGNGLLAEQLAGDRKLWAQLVGDEAVTEEVAVPSQRLGLVIGKKGRKLAEIQAESGAYVDVQRTNAAQEKVLLTGRRADVDAAKQIIAALVAKPRGKAEAWDEDDGSTYRAKCPIAKERHGSIIGKKGRTLAEIQRDYRVKVLVPQSTDADEFIQIKGAQEDVESALAHIRELVQAADARAAGRGRGRGRGRGGRGQGQGQAYSANNFLP
eukprot:CAMPEP_0114631806 /NCGR_PEP_ID=MMETSP0168-20121206/14604_1 /TAXON_ID=95228 ORGANISM="Vannella sp., Strain DIVA3 517/6/12" /NCGR_SAMPLE_ID=MMETSP0168 /ASSEMBLY_ACC=CAM_ASM_000044 /LENGTH=334 /DNA_ID=CAMNT_0001843387 /DNA_START=6 /DNA_END=1007 /DNA_ORIENTATION=-